MKNSMRLLTVVLSVSFIGFSAHSADKMYGVFMVVKGKVQILKDGKGSDAKVGAKIYEGESVVTVTDARAKIVMSDRNVLNISPETTLKIAKYENDAASGAKNVELNLEKGKVRSNVEQTYDGEKSKFQIKTPTAVAGVRGTQFQMGFDVKTQSTTIVTFKGSVTLATIAGGKVVGTVTVNKGETSSVSADKAPDAPKVLPKEEIKKAEGESTVSMNSKEGAATQSREVASESSGTTSGEAPAAGTKTMIDSKDVDANIAKDIKDVRTVAVEAPVAPLVPKINIVKDNTAVKDIISGQQGKTRVIVRPTLPGQN